MRYLTQEYLNSIFEYKEGALYWKIRPSYRADIGDMAGTLSNTGYYAVSIKRKKYSVHRLIFLMHHGYLPEIIDHIDGNKLNNTIENLRQVNSAQNIWNQPTRSTNTSGAKNVSWHKRQKKWNVKIMVNGVNKHIGCFDDFEFAELVSIEAIAKYHGEYRWRAI